jgi:hypothetical protein
MKIGMIFGATRAGWVDPSSNLTFYWADGLAIATELWGRFGEGIPKLVFTEVLVLEV